ncbi:hypothetical protein FDJ19_gp187 [Vibrio phage Ceto]|uniref:Uncharacterized protein n=1 Tax=Vibrio phage Ceto TaxID=2570300 RepID=A0A2H5BGJ2_9CAUD|nr:hypothetical protein FDJ19_gp187 [Vibrio phage Ceto]AUG85111.1 hypothetical protein CETO_125 [Vibrio phage Ceto]
MRWFFNKEKTEQKEEPNVPMLEKYATSLPRKEDLSAYQEELYQYFKKVVDTTLREAINNHIKPKDTFPLSIPRDSLNVPTEVFSYVIPRLLKEKGYSVTRYSETITFPHGVCHEYLLLLNETTSQE